MPKKLTQRKYHMHFINPYPQSADGEADGYRKKCKDPKCHTLNIKK